MVRNLKLNSFGALVLVLLLFAGTGFAQTSNGTVAGTISDKSGGVVVGANVTISNADLGVKRTVSTDSAGTYRVDALVPGIYVLTANASGFAELKISNIDVRGSVVTTINATLEVSGTTTTVTVEASAGQQLQTQSGEISATIGTKEVENLPMNSLNPVELALTLPGVQSVAPRDSLTNGVGFSVNGTRPRANNFLLDGQDNNDNGINGQAFQTTNHEAIGEVTVLTNAYSAEFGRGGGSVTNEIFKGGSNTWHGSAWDIINNSGLDAIPAELGRTVTKNPTSVENTFGFSVGGPIKKDKLFFFGTSQWDRTRQSPANLAGKLQLPTANGVATLQSLPANPRINFLLASLGSLRGIANPQMIALGSGRPAVQVGDVIRTTTAVAGNDRQWNFRVDYLPTSQDTLTVRYLRDDSSLFPDFFANPDSLPPFDTQQGGPSQNFGFTWIRSFASNKVNELRVSYGEIGFKFDGTPGTLTNPLSQMPSVVISSLVNGDGTNPNFGFPAGFPQFRNHRTYQFQDAYSWTLSRHTLKFGADVSLLFVSDGIPVDNRGTLTFNSGGGFTGLANYVDNFAGNGGSIDLFSGNVVIHPFAPNYAPYVQDTWRIRSNLSLDLGLRYEYWGTPENVLQFPALNTRAAGVGLLNSTFPSAFAAPQQGDKNNFAPRVGLAYTPRFWSRIFGQEKTVFRAGYGIFYDGLFTNILDNTAGGSPNGIQVTLNSNVSSGAPRGLANVTGAFAALQPAQSPLNAVSTIDSNLRNPITHQWNFDMQRAIPGNFVITTAYVGTRGIRLFANDDFNPGVGVDANGNLVRLNPNLGPITVRTNGGDSIYHAAQLTVDRKFSRGLLLRGAYAFSKFIDDTGEVFITSGGSSFPQNLGNRSADRGLSPFDRRHRFSLAYVYDLPYVHNASNLALKAVNAITRDWQTSGIISFQSGAPETVFDGFDVNNDGHSGNDRPNLGNPSAPFTSLGIDGTQFGFTATPGTFFPLQACLNGTPACVPTPASQFHFLIPDSGTGNLGRNTFISPGRQDWNLSVQRTFKLHERQSFLVRGEFFNAFNHPNTGIPTLNMLSSNFDNIARTINGGRIIKAWLKYSF
jgi:outer membrane receptor protein involved in Fe transport